MDERIVITGMGTINGLGHNLKETWKNIVEGVSGVSQITLFDTSEMLVKVACEVKDFDPEEFFSVREIRRRDRFELFSTIAAKEALRQAGLQITPENAGEIGAIISSAGGGIQSLQDASITYVQEGPRRISPFSSAMYMSSGGAGMTAIDLGLRGPSFSVASACASGADGLGVAWHLLRAGAMQAAVTGGSDASIVPVSVGGLDRSGAMSRRDGDSPITPQPFDLNRDGFVMGEGAAVMVLERESHARQRGATIHAELAGYASTCDAYHITAPREDGSGAAEAIRLALDSAGLTIQDVDYINAHGTGTLLNDVTETKAIKTVFGELAYDLPVSSTKSMTGHMMGVTAALEAIFCVLAIRHQVVPPTINYRTPDPDCDLDYVPNEARDHEVRVAVTNAFGFGGHNAVLVIRAYE